MGAKYSWIKKQIEPLCNDSGMYVTTPANN